MLIGIGTIGTALTLAFTALKASASFSDWTNQQKFARKQELALEILEAFFEGRQRLDSVRSSATFHYELEQARQTIAGWENSEFWTDAQKHQHESRLVVLHRIQQHDDYWNRLVGLFPKAKALFGHQAEQDFRAIIKARQKVWAAADVLPDLGDAPNASSPFKKILWKGYSKEEGADEDEIDTSLTEAQERLESHLGTFIH